MKTGPFLISIRGSFFNYVDNHGQTLVIVVKERPPNSIQDQNILPLKKESLPLMSPVGACTAIFGGWFFFAVCLEIFASEIMFKDKMAVSFFEQAKI